MYCMTREVFSIFVVARYLKMDNGHTSNPKYITFTGSVEPSRLGAATAAGLLHFPRHFRYSQEE